MSSATVGVFGGSGLYELLDEIELLEVGTPYGKPSDAIAIGTVDGNRVAFMPRHGATHTIPPAAINYRANIWAFNELGVERIIAPTAVGSLRADIKPGDFVVCDQFVDRTWGRSDSYFMEGPRVGHLSAADPYCPELRALAVEVGREQGVDVHDGGTVVVIQGPRFATRAESRWYGAQGWQVINMTQYPEVVLARELEICYVNIALVTDYDAGLEGDSSVSAVNVADVTSVMNSNNERVRRLIVALIERLPSVRSCTCGAAMRTAFIS
ncbi:MAG TPA: S-methyl-5'-thioadenosine phosphorylase [Candidatus Nitrosopolaris sp.]|nr:S-methyl-5'-thioadenosine phosphorylase [Candidatus Nitrosopolaris sp.]